MTQRDFCFLPVIGGVWFPAQNSAKHAFTGFYADTQLLSSCGFAVIVSSPAQFASHECEGDLGKWLLRREIGSGDKFMYTISGETPL